MLVESSYNSYVLTLSSNPFIYTGAKTQMGAKYETNISHRR